jgi:hypothetical protein
MRSRNIRAKANRRRIAGIPPPFLEVLGAVGLPALPIPSNQDETINRVEKLG